MVRGNRAIRNHKTNGRSLRLFQGARGEVTYLGEYEYVTHHEEKVAKSNGIGDRTVIVFELRPIE